MCWTIILTAILETVDDSVGMFLKRETKRAEKIREMAALENGGVLSVDRSLVISREDVEKRKVHEFKKVWDEASEWIGIVIKDAMNFALLNPSRATLQQVAEGSSALLSRSTALTAQIETTFNSNVWPSLKNRGWKSDVCATEEGIEYTRYFFRGNEVTIIVVKFFYWTYK
jgi:hypothetical protein